MAETERALRDWRNDDRMNEDDLYQHFEAFGQWEWPNIADEGRRAYNLMFDEEAEDGSPLANIYAAVAAQAAWGAYASVAAALGVDPRGLETAVAAWYENQDKLPASVSPEQLMEMVDEETKWWRDHDAGRWRAHPASDEETK